MRGASSTEGGFVGSGPGAAGDMARESGDSSRIGPRATLYMAFLLVVALFSISHGLGSAALNARNLASGGPASGDASVGIYFSNVAVHSLRAGLGVALLALVVLVLRRPSERGRHLFRMLLMSVTVVVFDAMAVASMAIHSTAYASDPLLEWSANYAFAPWLMLAGLFVALLGHREMLGRAGAIGRADASPERVSPD